MRLPRRSSRILKELSHRFELLGFFYALSSTVISVWQGVYLKMLMRTGLHKNFVHLMVLLDCRFIYATPR